MEGAGLPDFGGRGIAVGGTRGRFREVARISELGDPFGDGPGETETSEELPGGGTGSPLNGRMPTPPLGVLRMGLTAGELRPGEVGRSPVGVRTPGVLTSLVAGFGEVARSLMGAFPAVARKVALRAAVNAAPGAGTPLATGDASARRWLENLLGVVSGECDGIRRC